MNVFKQMIKKIMDAKERKDAYIVLRNGFIGSLSIIEREINICKSDDVTEAQLSASLSELMYEFSLMSKRIYEYYIEFSDTSNGRKQALKESMKSADRIIDYYNDRGSFRDLKTKGITINKDYGILQKIKESRMDLNQIIDYRGKSSLYIRGMAFLLTADLIHNIFLEASNEK